ncbi:MAG: hypothetical protein AB7K04_12075, partial [Pseudorhodoplanes sp.]
GVATGGAGMGAGWAGAGWMGAVAGEAATGAAAGGASAFTAPWQPGDSEAMLLFRQVSASMPPGVTPRHFDMKSERQLERMASRWAAVGCCAGAGAPLSTATIALASAPAIPDIKRLRMAASEN